MKLLIVLIMVWPLLLILLACHQSEPFEGPKGGFPRDDHAAQTKEHQIILNTIKEQCK